ncbi:MAG TPA: hypothetical protein G4O19_03465 [Dehalococcoidia bacterium]|nr:hypothetical protein [Dehalococcoidia bacterium]
MITTVSTTTVTTLTTVAALGLTAAISIATAGILVFFLTTKELATAKASGFSSRLGRFLSVSIVPLLMTFAVIMVTKIIEVLA